MLYRYYNIDILDIDVLDILDILDIDALDIIIYFAAARSVFISCKIRTSTIILLIFAYDFN